MTESTSEPEVGSTEANVALMLDKEITRRVHYALMDILCGYEVPRVSSDNKDTTSLRYDLVYELTEAVGNHIGQVAGSSALTHVIQRMVENEVTNRLAMHHQMTTTTNKVMYTSDSAYPCPHCGK